MTMLTDLDKVLRDAGLKVVEVPRWKTNQRPPSTGRFDPIGNLWHHTGGKDTNPQSLTDDYAYAKWLADIGRSDLPAPLCQVSIGRDGTAYLCASGRGNHAGKAKKAGPVPAGDGNRLYLGWECQNTGTEGWPEKQYEAMVRAAAATSRHYGWSGEANRAHKETSLTGKWDPGGLDMKRFRADVAARMAPKVTAMVKQPVGDVTVWNCKVGTRSTFTAELNALGKPPVIALMETIGHQRLIRAWAEKNGYQITQGTADRGASMILTRGNVELLGDGVLTVTTPWRGPKGKKIRGRVLPWVKVRIEGRLLTVLLVHMPWGPIVNRAATRDVMEAVRGYAKRNTGGDLLIPGDWNRKASSRAAYSPLGTAHVIDGWIVATGTSIDYGIFRPGRAPTQLARPQRVTGRKGTRLRSDHYVTTYDRKAAA